MSKVLIVFGTRPELIKLAPVVHEFRKRGLTQKISLLNTNQHKDLLKTCLELFDIQPDYNLDIMRSGQSLSELTAKAIFEIEHHIKLIKSENGVPAFILSQGDTNTVLASAVVAFLSNIKFAHLEAGLRTYDFSNPYPEEYNRKVASIAADIHFAPTDTAKDNLIKEGINGEKILVTGNTIVDALNLICSKISEGSSASSEILSRIYDRQNLILITCHRRENHGSNLKNLINAVIKLSDKYENYNFVWLLHPNPNVRSELKGSALKNHDNIFLTEPLSYIEIVKLYKRVKLILTDSGGIQEEAPSFGIPVLVIGKKTERMESILEGYSYLAGTNENEIIAAFDKHLEWEFEINKNPYGDGLASERIVDYFVKHL